MPEFRKDWALLQDARIKIVDVDSNPGLPGIAMRIGPAAAIGKNWIISPRVSIPSPSGSL